MTIHVIPINDLIEHVDDDCLCGPDYEYVDPDTGDSYHNGPLVVHHALDGRE
ncbi:MAG: hypothetical protein LC687_00530 [Actinobacteria bacterium]|nr:hypothetical protein [Actinomycetota bacterium]